MEYMILKEAGEKWGVSPRRVNSYCADGRIPGAVKMVTIFLIPKDAQKPVDGRIKQGKERKVERNFHPYVFGPTPTWEKPKRERHGNKYE